MGSFVNFFRLSNDFISQKVYFSRLIRVYFALIMLAVFFFIPANHNLKTGCVPYLGLELTMHVLKIQMRDSPFKTANTSGITKIEGQGTTRAKQEYLC